MGTGGRIEVRRLHLGYVRYPEAHPLAGEDGPVLAYLVRHSDGVGLVDTGAGDDHPRIAELYRPRLVPLPDALEAAGSRLDEVTHVVLSHLHFDHVGGARRLPGVPLYVQRAEYEASRATGYTVADWVDFPGARYALLDGEHELLPGVRIIPAAGHTPGHQCVLVETDEGRVLIAAQAAADVPQYLEPESEHRDPPSPQAVATLRRLHALQPDIVHLSHDERTWRRDG